MSETLASLSAKVQSAIQDTGTLMSASSGGDLEQSIREALENYSRVLPYVVVTDVAGDGATYDLTLPGTYIDGFSRFTTIEYPAGQRVPAYLPSDAWVIYRTASALKLRLRDDTPSATESVRLTYTALHTITGLDAAITTTIPANHTYAFVKLAAHFALLRLAARYISEREATLNLDNVDRQSKADVARRLADAFLKEYRDTLNLTAGEGPALAFVTQRSTFADTGIVELTHRRRRSR